MSLKLHNETWTLTLPDIPALTTYPLTVSIPTSALRTLMRLVVVIGTYMLFRPHLERLFRKTLGQDDPAGKVASVPELQRRMKTIEKEKGVVIGGGKKAAVVTGTGGKSAPTVAPAQTPRTRKKA